MYSCKCKKYNKIKFRGIICHKCNREVLLNGGKINYFFIDFIKKTIFLKNYLLYILNKWEIPFVGSAKWQIFTQK